MSYSFGPRARQLGERVREWLRAELEPGWAHRYRPSTPEWVEFQREWDRKLYRAGWGAIFWPKQFGGLDATAEERVIFAKAMAEAGAPEGLGKLGKRLLAPVLIAHGTPEQQAEHLPAILRGEVSWAQGFSEPGAGSDLASLRTRGVVDGDRIVLNGHKIWTSHAWYSDAIFALVRTSTEQRKQDGISFVLVPTTTPGVRIERIHQINRKTEFSEVFFTDAPLPLSNVVGPVGAGWRIAKSLLQYERGAEMVFGRSAEIRESVRSLVGDLHRPDARVTERTREGLGRLQARYVASEINALRLLGQQISGAEPGDLSAVVKLAHTEAWRHGTVEQLRLLGATAAGTGWPHFERYFNSRSSTIASGTSEVQREIIARRVLRL